MTTFTTTADVKKACFDIAFILDIAQRLTERSDGATNDDITGLRGAAWRIADAGLMLRDLLADLGVTQGCGIDSPTGRGAVLPTLVGEG